MLVLKKNNDTKILDENSSLIALLKKNGWEEFKETTEKEEVENAKTRTTKHK